MRNKPRLPILDRSRPLARRLVGAWPLYEGSGTTTRDLARSTSGTFVNSPTWVNASGGRAVDLTGSIGSEADYINVGTMPTMTEWSFVVVAYPDATTTLQTVFSNDRAGWNDDILFGIQPESVGETAGAWACIHQDMTSQVRTIVTAPAAAALNVRTSVAVTSDGATLRLYINGELINETAKAGTALSFGGAPCWIGNSPNVATRTFNGQVEALYLYSATLPGASVRGLHNDMYAMMRPRVYWPAVEVAAAPGAGGLLPILMQHGQYTGGTI